MMFADNSTSTSSKKDLLSAPDRVNGMGKSPPYDVNPLYKMVKLLENISVSMTCVSSTFSYEIALHTSYVTLPWSKSILPWSIDPPRSLEMDREFLLIVLSMLPHPFWYLHEHLI